MIEFNLLPDVKLEYVKTRRIERLVIAGSLLAAAAALVVFIFLLVFVDVLQKNHLSDIDSNIKTSSAQLQAMPSLNKILTIQNQLQALPALHDQKPVTSRLFTYMAQLTPAKATISSLNIDFTTHTLTIAGNADSLATIDQFADTLKFTTYTVSGSHGAPLVFSDVVTTLSPGATSASYTITSVFNPVIFDGTKTVALTVPQITSTRSITEQPTDLFKQAPNTSKP